MIKGLIEKRGFVEGLDFSEVLEIEHNFSYAMKQMRTNRNGGYLYGFEIIR